MRQFLTDPKANSGNNWFRHAFFEIFL